MASLTAEAHSQAERSQRRLAKLNDERTRLLQAHYAGAVPIDLLKAEMQRLTAAVRDAEQQTRAAGAHLADVETVLEQALVAAGTARRSTRRHRGS